jgi:hypothetical protein
MEEQAMAEPERTSAKTFLKAMPLRDLSMLEKVKNEVRSGNILILKLTLSTTEVGRFLLLECSLGRLFTAILGSHLILFHLRSRGCATLVNATSTEAACV